MLGHLSGENNFPELAYASVSCALEENGLVPGRDLALSVARRDGHSELFSMEFYDRTAELSALGVLLTINCILAPQESRRPG